MAIFCGCMLLHTLIDYKFQLLPDLVTYLLFISGAVYSLVFASPLEGVLGSCLFGGCLALVYYLTQEGLGFGDVKLGFALGLWLGILPSWVCLLLALWLGVLVGGLCYLFNRLEPGQTMPFGPYLCFSASLMLFKGDFILLQWKSMFPYFSLGAW